MNNYSFKILLSSFLLCIFLTFPLNASADDSTGGSAAAAKADDSNSVDTDTTQAVAEFANSCKITHEGSEYFKADGADCTSSGDGVHCLFSTWLETIDFNCKNKECTPFTTSSVNCDDFDVPATCDAKGKDYYCNNGDYVDKECQYRELPQITRDANGDCPECVTPSHCGTDVTATCNDTGISHYCENGLCGFNLFPTLTGGGDGCACNTPSDCGTDVAATCSSSGISHSCNNGLCGSSTIPQLTGGDCDCPNTRRGTRDGNGDCTVATLTSFTITASYGKVKLKWETASEIDNAGFHIMRAVGDDWKDGDYSTVIRLTDKLIPAKGDGASYSYTDSNVKSGVTYYYALEDIDLFGKSTVHQDFIDSVTMP
jgi:hypothetical protein